MKLEKMDLFFEKRAADYDRHMLEEVDGCKEGYRKLASCLPQNLHTLLDLGCGTGLELAPIFARFPALKVTGVDLAQGMLLRLREKYPDKNITLLKKSYLGCSFGTAVFDAAVSFETMHHMTHAEKRSVYTEICRALRPGGQYLEADFVAVNQAEEDRLYAENCRLRRAEHISGGVLCHFDTPCTVENQIGLLLQAGFRSAKLTWQQGNTALIIAEKE